MKTENQFYQYSVSLPLPKEDKHIFDQLNIKLPDTLLNAHKNRKEQYLIGRYCAYRALRSAGFAGDFHLPSNDDGSPLWPEGHVGSITHTKNYVSAIVGLTTIYRGLGIDSQLIMNEKTFISIHKKVMTQNELQMTLPGWNFLEVATLVFSFKESIYKCLRPLCGQFFGFSDAEIIDINFKKKSVKYGLLNEIGRGFNSSFIGEGIFDKTNGLIHTLVEYKSNTFTG
jgi:enterobactin synthetase component D